MPARRRSIVPLAVATLSTQASIVVLAPIIVQVADSLGASVSAAGQARAVLAGTAAIGSLVVGSLIDRIGVRPLLVAGSLLSVAGAAMTAAAPSMTIFYLVQVPTGLGVACMLSGGFAGVASYFEGGADRAWAMGHVVGTQSLAWIIGNPIVGFLTEAVSWRLAYVVPAAVALAALATTLALLPPAPPRRRVGGRPEGIRAVLRDRSARLWTLSELIAYSVWTAELTFAGAFYIQTYGASEAAVGLLLALPSAAFLVFSPRVAAVARRLGQRAVVVIGGIGMGALLLVLFTVTPSIAFTLPLFCLVAVFAALRLTGSSTLGLGQLPGRSGAMMSARTAAAQFGYMVGALAGGVVLAAGGFAGLGLFLMAGLLVASLVVARVTVPEWLPGGPPPDTGEAPRLEIPD
jgi:predicted MFS family arabinose efflux permease